MVARKKTSTQEQEGQVEEVLSADELKAVSEGEPVESAVHKKRTVVVAEDESVNRMDLVAMLEDNGYEVVGEAANGEEAVDLTRKFRPDIVCMDVKMPRMDGIAAAGVICDENIAPVVMLTAFSQPDLVRQATGAGAMAYVTKPYEESKLLPALEVAILRSQTGEAPGDAGVVYLLRLQPDAQYLGRRHWYPLSFVLPARVTGQHYYAAFLAQYYHQLAGLYFTGRDYLYRGRGGVAGSLVCRSNYAAYSRYWLTDDYRGLFVVLRFREAPPYDHQRAKAGAAFMEIRPRSDADFQR